MLAHDAVNGLAGRKPVHVGRFRLVVVTCHGGRVEGVRIHEIEVRTGEVGAHADGRRPGGHGEPHGLGQFFIQNLAALVVDAHDLRRGGEIGAHVLIAGEGSGQREIDIAVGALDDTFDLTAFVSNPLLDGIRRRIDDDQTVAASGKELAAGEDHAGLDGPFGGERPESTLHRGAHLDGTVAQRQRADSRRGLHARLGILHIGLRRTADHQSLQKEALTLALGKADQKPEDMRYLFAGDLLGQLIASSFGLKTFEIPLFGLYGACSTCGEALALSAMTVAAGYADRVAAVTSSHFASAEKQFRFPLEYANQRPVSATWTVTGGGAFILSKDAKQPLAKVAGVTTGKIVDYGIKDSMNMGAVMAPAAAELIAQNLTDFKRKPEDYDRIITGDLGEVGQQILFDLLLKKGMDIRKQHEDCGMLIFDSQTQGTGSGGSGCGCAASVLSAHFLPKLASGELKRILFVPTGALLSTVSFNEGQTIPGIAHGVVLESCVSSAKKEG